MPTHPAVFPDCAFPQDCQCAARGYALERDSCAVPAVRQAATDLGLDPSGLLRPARPSPTIKLSRSSAVMALGAGDDLGVDLRAAIDASGARDLVAHTPAQLKLVIDHNKAVSGLRAEAGYGGPMIIQLWSSGERLATGRRLGCWLVFSATPVGDAVYWLVSVMDGTDTALQFARKDDADIAIGMLRSAAGGESSEYSEAPCELYTEADLDLIRRQ